MGKYTEVKHDEIAKTTSDVLGRLSKKTRCEEPTADTNSVPSGQNQTEVQHKEITETISDLRGRPSKMTRSDEATSNTSGALSRGYHTKVKHGEIAETTSDVRRRPSSMSRKMLKIAVLSGDVLGTDMQIIHPSTGMGHQHQGPKYGSKSERRMGDPSTQCQALRAPPEEAGIGQNHGNAADHELVSLDGSGIPQRSRGHSHPWRTQGDENNAQT